jgi:dTDP-glucose 4,6-dehydratase
MPRYVAVTGCAGFIGRVVTRKLLERGDYVYGIDALTYAADPDCIQGFRASFADSFSFVARDIRELGRWPDVDAVCHLAAETHVDNSLTEGPRFVGTNIDGTAHLLEMTRAKSQHGMPHFIHISTDEVYGSVDSGSVAEDAPLRPTSPYAASKAAADLLVQAWGKTYGVPYAILRPTNCYGPGQYPEKLIPKCVRSLMLGRPIPIHGDGSQTRCWLNVEDLADAILLVLDQRLEGIYNVGGNSEVAVKEVARAIFGKFYPHDDNGVPLNDGMELGFQRPACDLRYAVDDSRIRAAGWKPTGDFWKDLPALVEAERGRFRF